MLLSQFTQFHTHISFHTPRPLFCCTARGVQPARSDYLEHEFHGLLELYLLHRIYLLSAKQGQYHSLRQLLSSYTSRSLYTILSTTGYAAEINLVQDSGMDILNFKCYSTLLSAKVDFFFFLLQALMILCIF